MRRLLIATIAAAAGWAGVAVAQEDGLSLLKQHWTSAETASDGLGPLYNEASCHACHWFGIGARVRVPGDMSAGVG